MLGNDNNIFQPQLVTANSNPLTGRIAKVMAGSTALGAVGSLGGASLGERFRALLGSGKKVGIHLYGNSFGASLANHFFRACSASDGRMTVVANSSVGGYKTADIIAKMLVDGFDDNSQVVALFEGTNDAVNTLTNAQHIANFRVLIAMVVDAGRIPILTLAPPNDNAYSSLVNGFALRERYLCEVLGVPVYDPWARYVDTDGTWIAGASPDLTHPTNAIYGSAGDDLWASISAGANQVLLPRSNTGFGLRAANVLQLTDTNTDGLPDGWSQLSLTTPSFALTAYAFPFRGQRCAATLSQTGTGYLFTEVSTGFAIGDKIRFSGVCGLASSTNMMMRAFVRCSGTGKDITGFIANADSTEYSFETDFIVPTGTTKFQLWIQTDTSTTGAYSGVVKFGGIDITNLTALGIT